MDDEAPFEKAAGSEASAAAAMALSRTGGGGSLDARAEAYLEKQARLTDLQIENLHEERKLSLEHLRWRAFSDRMKAVLEVMVAAVGAAVVIGVVWMAWSASQERGLVIEPFSVPPDLAQRGLTGQVVASMLLDKLGEMQNATVSARPPSTYANNWNDEIKVQIPETGVSVGELRRLLVRWLGRQTTISGELFRTPTGLRLDARTGTAPAKGHAGSDTDIDALVLAAAEDVYATTQPYRYAVYLSNKGDPVSLQRSVAALRKLAATGDKTDRLWANIGLVGTLQNVGDYAGARAAADQAIALEPRFSMAYANRSGVESSLGHDEAQLADVRMATSTAERYGHEFLTPQALAYLTPLDRSSVAALLGDWRTAAREQSVALATRPGNGDWRLQVVLDNAFAHELQAARAAGAGLTIPDAADRSPEAMIHRLRSSAGQALIGMTLDDWAGVKATFQPLMSDENLPPGLRATFKTNVQPYLALALAKLGEGPAAETMISTTPLDCYFCVRVRGQVAAERRDWPAADRWFAEAVRQGPSMPFAYAEWGQALLARGDAAGAAEKFRLARAKGPHFADAAELWGEALLARGDAKGAAARFAEADQDAPHWGRNHLRWGQALAKLGRTDDAKAQWRIAARLDLSVADRAELAKAVR